MRRTALEQSLRRQGKGAPPIIYGHRGARGMRPENTMAGFRYLVDHGFTAVELDVQNASDGTPVILHDPWIPEAIARDATGRWLACAGPKVIECSLDRLASYDVGRLKPGHEYGARYPGQSPCDGQRIPTLDDFCRWARGYPDLLINIEVKSCGDRDDLGDPPARLVDGLLDVVARHGVDRRLVVSSFDWRVLSATADAAPSLARAYLSYLARPGRSTPPNIVSGSAWMDGLRLEDANNSLPTLIAAQGAAAWCPYYRDLTQEDLTCAHTLGLAVNVWTVNQPEDMLRLERMGVDGIITDYPLIAQSLFGSGKPRGTPV